MTLASVTDPRPRGGRPLRLTQEVADKIVEAVEQGSYLKIAAQAAGVGQSTLAGWLAKGRQVASARDAHDPDHVYCPNCDLDRTDEVLARDTEQERLDAEYADAVEQWQHDTSSAPDDYVRPDPPVHVGVALDRCPNCSEPEEPETWDVLPEEAPFLELLESVTRAQAASEVQAVAAWRRAFTGPEPDWRAARDYLARVAPERWAGVTRVQMTGEEAERRIEDAVNETLIALGVDMHGEQLDDDLTDPDREDES